MREWYYTKREVTVKFLLEKQSFALEKQQNYKGHFLSQIHSEFMDKSDKSELMATSQLDKVIQYPLRVPTGCW